MTESKSPSPSNCVEFINADGSRFAWSESNVRYEPVPKDGESFTLLRMRLMKAEARFRLAEEAIKCGESLAEIANGNMRHRVLAFHNAVMKVRSAP